MARVLIVSPHPDDEAIGCGGTLCAHAAQGDEIRVVYLTSGEAGGHGRDPEATGALREQEALAAAAKLGVRDLEFWRAPDGALRVTKTLVERLQDTFEKWSPDVLYTTHRGEAHPDHRAAQRIVKAACASRAAPPQVLEFEVWTPLTVMDHIVDVSPWMDQKLAAVRAYESQCALLRFDDAVAGLNRYRGEMHSWPGGDYAEVFRKMQR